MSGLRLFFFRLPFLPPSCSIYVRCRGCGRSRFARTCRGTKEQLADRVAANVKHLACNSLPVPREMSFNFTTEKGNHHLDSENSAERNLSWH
ncbi:hypothetical protein B0H17DRAFT_315085 [Mycena rosella]|uniref:Secreted protein n=1 Tax=Mycena rosella TaxID=1033263 RepID=A0AAD7DUZ6_MYCRO|nr:hypothetical protein B0H17DRAFT_315085 [Mycena rosella]